MAPLAGDHPDAREPITEPSGQGPFAEAMRELIADLRPLRPANQGGAPRHLRLVR